MKYIKRAIEDVVIQLDKSLKAFLSLVHGKPVRQA